MIPKNGKGGQGKSLKDVTELDEGLDSSMRLYVVSIESVGHEMFFPDCLLSRSQ